MSGSKANDRQVGGDHYRKAAGDGEQHWDRMWRLFGRAWFIGNITAYAERYHLKNGIQDLDKIAHYVEKLKELEKAWAAGTGPAPGSAGGDMLPDLTYHPPEHNPDEDDVPL